MKGTKFEVELDTGKVVSGREDWTTKVATYLFTDWSAGASPHFGISQSRGQAIASKYPEVILGNYNGTPVLDTEAILDMILEKADEGLGIEVQRIANSRKVQGSKMEKAKVALSESGLFTEAQMEVIRSLLK